MKLRLGSLIPILVLGIAGSPLRAMAQHGNHGTHPLLPDQPYYFQCRIVSPDGPIVANVPLALPSVANPRDFDQSVTVHDSIPPLRLTKYLPRAVFKQRVERTDRQDGLAALRVSVNGPTQSLDRWLVAGDPARDRLRSFIGTWRYQTVSSPGERDALFKLFEQELIRKPMLRVTRLDHDLTRTVPALAGSEQTLKDLGCSIRISAFHPHFAIDDKTGQATNLSDRRLNPAALVELAHQDAKSTFWVFARFPDFAKQSSNDLPFRITLECPVDVPRSTPDFMLTTDAHGTMALWSRYQGQVTTQTLKLNNDIKIKASQYSFRVAEFIPRGRLIEHYEPTDHKNGIPALRVEAIGPDGKPVVHWLKYGSSRVLPTALGPMTIAFGPLPSRVPGGHQ